MERRTARRGRDGTVVSRADAWQHMNSKLPTQTANRREAATRSHRAD